MFYPDWTHLKAHCHFSDITLTTFTIFKTRIGSKKYLSGSWFSLSSSSYPQLTQLSGYNCTTWCLQNSSADTSGYLLHYWNALNLWSSFPWTISKVDSIFSNLLSKFWEIQLKTNSRNFEISTTRTNEFWFVSVIAQCLIWQHHGWKKWCHHHVIIVKV